MSALSDYAEVKILDIITGRSGVSFNGTTTTGTTMYLGLSTGDFSDTGSGSSELTIGTNGYARAAVAFDAATVGTGAPASTTQNTSAIDFNAATGNWGTISNWGLYDAATGGNVVLTGSFSASKTIETNDVLRIAAGDLDLSAT